MLIRHAKPGHPGGVRDHDRPPADRGREDATPAGNRLSARPGGVEQILCSTALRGLRARQTALAARLLAAGRDQHGADQVAAGPTASTAVPEVTGGWADVIAGARLLFHLPGA